MNVFFSGSGTEDPAEESDVFMLSSIKQCEEFRGFQGHGYVQHAQECGQGHTCDSAVQHDGAITHILRKSVNVLHEGFLFCLLSRFRDLNWPPKHPALRVPLFLSEESRVLRSVC